MSRHSLFHLAVLISLSSFTGSPQAQRSELPTQVNVPGVVEAKWITVSDRLDRTSQESPIFYSVANGDLRQLTRTYILTAGQWQLLSNTQLRDPRQ
jgi:hypothetical protein